MDPPAASRSGRDDDPSDAREWGIALLSAAVAFIIAYLGFVIVPNGLATSHYLSTHLVSKAHDAVVLLWVVVFFVFQSWLFVRLQRSWGRGRRAVRG